MGKNDKYMLAKLAKCLKLREREANKKAIFHSPLQSAKKKLKAPQNMKIKTNPWI